MLKSEMDEKKLSKFFLLIEIIKNSGRYMTGFKINLIKMTQ